MPNPFKNTEEKLLRTNAAIWLNKVCGFNNSAANCIKITINVKVSNYLKLLNSVYVLGTLRKQGQQHTEYCRSVTVSSYWSTHEQLVQI